MFDALVDYFMNLFAIVDYDLLDTFSLELGGQNISMHMWLGYTCAIVAMLLIIVACIAFVWKITKVVARLFTGA